MASYEVEQFANEIGKALADEVILAKADYKKRMEAISSFYNTPDSFDYILQVGETTRGQLANGAMNEMQRIQREQNSVMEAQIKKVDDKLSFLVGNPEFVMDIVYLSSKLDDWIKKFEELSIPKGAHSNAYPYSAGRTMKNIQLKWKNFCATDPTIKKAELYKRKAKIENEIASLKKTISELEKNLPELRDEFEDRSSNIEKYEIRVKTEVADEVEAIDIELRHAIEDVSDLETQKKIIQSELSSTGLLALGKKKELKAKLEQLSRNISDAKEKIAPIEARRKAAQDSLPSRITSLTDKIMSLKKEISDSEATLKRSLTSLENSETELKKVIEAIEK